MKSVISLSMHKAGSSIADRIIGDFCTEKGYELDRIARQVPDSPSPEGELFVSYQDHMKLDDVYYGMARGPYVKDMDIIDRLKTIIQIRDPRDCITSAYFSFKESHVLPNNPEKRAKFQHRRDTVSQLTIDDYAATNAENYKMRMNVLRNIIESHADVLLLRYEDMVEDTEKWLTQISEFLGQPVTENVRERLGNKTNFTVNSEDVTKHKRQVSPRDHVRKLSGSTINTMNETLRDPLQYFGYTHNVQLL
mgnify:CR=1 FL=1